MSFRDDCLDCDWRAYLIKNAKPVTDVGEAMDEPADVKPAPIGERYGYQTPPSRYARGRR